MLKKIYRLSSVKLTKPKNISGDLFNLRTQRNTLDYPRFGFVISKKIDKRAVVRNSLKRKLSLSVEEIFDRIEGGNDFVFYPRSIAVNASSDKVTQELKIIFSREGFLND